MKTITITITIDTLPLKTWLTNPWRVRPGKWRRFHMKKAAQEIAAHERHYIPQIKYLRKKVKEHGFSWEDVGLKEAKGAVDKMIKLGYLERI
jgi:hypothetical protein